MLSLGRMDSPSAQWDAGHTTDSRRGTRWITTFKKADNKAEKDGDED